MTENIMAGENFLKISFFGEILSMSLLMLLLNFIVGDFPKLHDFCARIILQRF